MKALIHASLYDYTNYASDAYVLFDDQILDVGEMSAFRGADEVVDCRNTMVLPGLINCHAHLYATLARGLALTFQPNSFQQILDQLWWRIDSKIDHEVLHLSALVSGIEQLKSGVTTTIDHHASGTGILGSLSVIRKALCEVLGMRAILCFETSDRFPVEDCIEENLANAASPSHGMYAGLFGLHASLSLSNETLKMVALSRGNLPIHIHVGESAEDDADSRLRYGMSPIKRLHALGLLSKNAILAHCVHVDEQDLKLIKATGAAIAVNPTSNMNNAVGLPDVLRFRQMGIPVVIGNDSLGTHLVRDWQNTLYTAHLKSESPWQIGYSDLKDMIKESYRLAGDLLGIPLGRFQKGYAADFIALPYRPPTPIHADNVFGHLVDGLFSQFCPRDVWVRGKQVVKNHETAFDEETIYQEAQRTANLFWKKIREENHGEADKPHPVT